MATPIKVQILGDAKGLTTALGQAKAQLKAFGLASNKGKLLAGGAATAIVGLGVAAAKMALDMDQAKKDFELSTGLVGEAADDAFQQVLDAAGQVPDSIDAVIEAGGNLATTTGILGEDLENLTVQFMDLNRLGFGAINENQVGEMFNTWGLEGQNATDMLDNLAEVSQATGVDIGMLSDLVTSNAGAFMKWGLDGEEAVQMLGQWEKAGIDSNKVVRGLNSNIDMLTAQGKDTTKMLEDMTKVMDDGNISTEEATLLYDLFGAEATDVIAQLEAGTISLKDFDKEMGMSGQTVQEMTDASATVGEKFSELRNKIMVKLGPALVALGEKLIQLVDWFIEDALPAIEKFTADAVKFVKDFSEDTIAFFQKVWDYVGPLLTQLWEHVKLTFDTIVQVFKAFKAIFKGDWKGLWQAVRNILKNGLDLLVSAVKIWWQTFKLWWSTIGSNIIKALAAGLATLRKWFVGRMQALKDGAIGKIESLITWFRGVPGKITAAISGGLSKLKELGSKIVNWIVQGIKDAGSAIGQAIRDLIPSPGDITGWIGSKIPGFAHGGPLPSGGGMALVGERGPELIKVPNSMGGAQVISNREMGSAGGGDIHVHVGGSSATPGQIGQAVVWAMRQGG